VNSLNTTLAVSSHAGPALATRGDTMLMGWVEPNDLKLQFAQTRDGNHLFAEVTLAETSDRALALAVFNDKYTVAWISSASEQIQLMQSDDGINWEPKVTLQESSPSEPALAVFKDELYLAWRNSEDDYICLLRSADGKTWADKVTLPERTSEGPALVTVGDQLIVVCVESRVALDLFITGSDGKIRHKRREPSGWLPAGDDWDMLDFEIEGQVNAVASDADCIDLFARGKDNHLYHKRRDESGWLGDLDGAWNDLGEHCAVTPTALAWARDDIVIFTVAKDNTVWHKRYDGTALLMGNTGWECLPASTENPVCAVSTGLNEFCILETHTNKYIYHRWWHVTKWGQDWTWLGFPTNNLTTQPVNAVITGPNSFILLARKSQDGTVYLKWWQGKAGWSPPQAVQWSHLGSNMTDPPTGVAWGRRWPKTESWAERNFDLFARGMDGAVWHKRYLKDKSLKNKWEPDGTNWESLGGSAQGSICAVSSGPNSFDVFIRGSDNAVWHKHWDGTQWLPSATGWDRIGGETVVSPVAVGQRTNGQLCVLRSSDGTNFNKMDVPKGTTRSRPYLLADNSGAWLALHKPADDSIQLFACTDGATWQEKTTGTTETCHDAPALTSWNGQLVLCWTGADAQQRLHLFSPGPSDVAKNPTVIPPKSKADRTSPPASQTSLPAPDSQQPAATSGQITYQSGRPLPRTTGLEDFAYYTELFKDRTGAGDPPFRRGGIWS